MAQAIWKGSISFGLVHVPVAVYSGEQRNELSFTMLDKRNLSPVGYKRINKASGDEVSWDDIVKGYEYRKGEYVVLDEEDFRKANVEATQTVEIVDFVEAGAIPLSYYDKPYYLVPIQKGEKAYALLRETLKRTHKVGVAKVVLRNRQHLAALVAQGDMLVLELLRFPSELRDTAEYKVPGEDLAALGITQKELDMAQRLVEGMVEQWDPRKYKDSYREDLMRAIEEKARTGQVAAVEAVPEAEAPRAEVIDLMAQLKRSVEEAQKQRGKKVAARRAPAERRA